MKLTATPIPPDSHELRWWRNEPPGDGDSGADIDMVAVLRHLSDDTCEVALGHGRFCRRSGLALVKLAKTMGYKTLKFSRHKPGEIRTYATLVKSDNGFGHYEMDLG